MGRLIDADIFYDNIVEGTDLGAEDNVDEALKRYLDLEPTVEAIPKDDYENRLKADMVAMLTELQLEIEELDSRAGYSGDGMPTFSTDYIRKKKVNELIQQKINALKGDTE